MRRFAASHIDTATPQENLNNLWRNMLEPLKRAFRARLPSIFRLCSDKIDVFLKFSHEPQNLPPQNRCFVPVNFHHISQNATPAMEFAHCDHLTQPWQCDPPKTRNTTCLKCCACHILECHKVPRLPRETKATRRFKPPKKTAFAELAMARPWPSRGRLRTQNATSSEHILNPQTPQKR